MSLYSKIGMEAGAMKLITSEKKSMNYWIMRKYCGFRGLRHNGWALVIETLNISTQRHQIFPLKGIRKEEKEHNNWTVG